MYKTITCLLIFFCFAASAFGQITVSGTVVFDVSGEVVPNASVVIKGTRTGIFTDDKGNYKLDNVAPDATLVVNYVGFGPQEIAVEGRSSITVRLVENIRDLDPVVVVGYGTQRKSDLTGAVGTVEMDALVQAPISNFDQALAGRVAGVEVSAGQGTPGDEARIVIRGGNSITGDNSPLFVIDGVPFEDFDPASINTNDIKSIDVLKDASATAIYGSRGANGVILITTKSGRADGKTEISFRSNMGTQFIATRLPVMGPYEYVTHIERLALMQDGFNPGSETQNFIETWVDPELYRDVAGTDWQEEVFQQASFRDYGLSVSAGNKNTRLYYSGQFVDQEGTVINTGFNKVVNNVRLQQKVGDRIKVDASLMHSLSSRTGVGVNGNGFSGIIIRDVIRFRPVEPINDDALDGFDPESGDGRWLYNPIDNLNNTDRRDRRELFRGTLNAEAKLHKALTLVGTASYQSQNRRNSVFNGAQTFQGERGNNGISGSITNQRLQILTGSSYLRFAPKISKAQKLTVTGGIEAQTRSLEESGLSSTQLPTDVFGIDNLGIGLVAPIPSTGFSASTLFSYFGRVNYNYKRRYLVTVNFRADGSSKFREENRWGYFPSFSLAWNIAEEAFLNDAAFLSRLKLRGGWGRTGNNRIGDFDAFTTLSATNNSGYVTGPNETYQVGAIVNNLGVPNLRWETTDQFNIGLDYGLFDGRIQGEIDLYRKRTIDLLLNADMASSTGFVQVQQNVGEVENRGLEIALRSYNIDAKNFSWSSNFNIAFNRNKVISLNQGQDAIFTDPQRINLNEFQYITQVGQPVGQIYGLQYDGLYQVDDFVWDAETNNFELKEGIPDNGGRPAPGSVKFVDVDGDGTITEADRSAIGNTTPAFIGGFANTFQYMGFDLQVFFQGSFGADILNLNRVEFESPTGSRQNAFVAVLDQWTPSQTETDVHTYAFGQTFGRPINGTRISDRYVEDGSFLRLKTVSLGYNLPQRWLARVRIKSCRLSFAAQNLYTWTSYSGYDPEVSVPPNNGISRALAPNLDFSAYPQSVTLTGGIALSF